jgi:hypothetical protein
LLKLILTAKELLDRHAHGLGDHALEGGEVLGLHRARVDQCLEHRDRLRDLFRLIAFARGSHGRHHLLLHHLLHELLALLVTHLEQRAKLLHGIEAHAGAGRPLAIFATQSHPHRREQLGSREPKAARIQPFERTTSLGALVEHFADKPLDAHEGSHGLGILGKEAEELCLLGERLGLVEHRDRRVDALQQHRAPHLLEAAAHLPQAEPGANRLVLGGIELLENGDGERRGAVLIQVELGALLWCTRCCDVDRRA